MHFFTQQVVQFKSCFFKVEYFFHAFIVFITGFILLWAIFALFHPVNARQEQQVIMLARQATYPKTQEMALLLLKREPICKEEYLKLMRSYQFEQKQMKYYSPVRLEDAL